MITTWNELTNALRDREDSVKFASLIASIGEQPKISETPEKYNDPDGKTKYYKFVNGPGRRATPIRHLRRRRRFGRELEALLDVINRPRLR